MARRTALDRPVAEALAERLRQLRTAAGLSQEAVAITAGLDRNHYQLLEAGLSDRKKRTPANPTLSTLVALCRVYGTTVPELVVDIFRVAPDASPVEYDERTHGATDDERAR